MPSYRTHTSINYLLILFLSLYLYYTNQFDIIIFLFFLFGFIIGTDYITPDCDTKSKPYSRLFFLWYPYRKNSKHRGISHTILGIFIRISYILLIIFSISYLLNQHEILISSLKLIQPIYYLLILLGIVISNLIHITLDRIF